MQSKTEITTSFQTKWAEVESLIAGMADDKFVAKPDPEVWSIAEEFDHVVKSAAAVSSAMKVSPFILKWKFGKPNRDIRNYDECFNRYHEKLASVRGKAVAPSPFISEEGKSFNKDSMLNHWGMTGNKLEKHIRKWSDNNLDKVLIPHPLLGKMMVREILFFTHFHTEHHLKSLKKKANQQPLQ
ncbi:MAG: hypothetical protein COA58_10275 [Bacteroidetes bacterium]|nr:MAG: hypothetical protein COA58_10275 [Bacteroidota bacterium]